MATQGFLLFIISGFSVALLLVVFINNTIHINQSTSLTSNLPVSSSLFSEKVWHELEFSWRIVLATTIGFLASSFGTVSGVDGGGIFVPMLTLIVGFDTKSTAALYKCMIAASAAFVWYHLRVLHPTKNSPILDYDLEIMFQSMLLLGITLGVSLSVAFSYWLFTILIIIFFLGVSLRFDSYSSNNVIDMVYTAHNYMYPTFLIRYKKFSIQKFKCHEGH